MAIKVVSVHDDAARERFAAECSALGALSGHPNIVIVYETGVTADGRPFMVMEFLAGGSLGSRLATEGPLPWSTVTSIGVKLAGALESAHRAGVLHRDVKPDNVLLSRYGDAKLADFGMAAVGQAHDDIASLATLVHAAPETVAGRQATARSDIYSLGSTLHTLLAGRPPFAAGDDLAWVRVAADVARTPPPDLRPLGVPDQLCAVLEGAMAKDPDGRPADAAQFGRQLQAVEAEHDLDITVLPIELGARPAAAPAAQRSGLPVRSRPRRLTRWLQLAGLVLVIAAALGIVLRGTGQGSVALSRIYGDNFEAGQGWYEHSDAVATLGYDGTGGYRIKVAGTGREAISDSSFRGASYGRGYTKLGDVSVQVSARSTSGSGLVGVTCRQSPDAGSYYEGLLGADGTGRIARYDDHGLRVLADVRSLPPAGATFNRLRLDCIGGRHDTDLRLFVDDRPVVHAVDRAGLGRGSIGLAVDSGTAEGAEAVFDDVIVFGHRSDVS